MDRPIVTLVLTTYQKPNHLRRVLTSISLQQNAAGMELIVADDGSTDETERIVRAFASTVPFRVDWTTHPHTIFCPARSRNEGAAAGTGEYLLFLDGDCVLPADHVAQHLARRRPGWAMVGDCIRLEEEESNRLSDEVIHSGSYRAWGPKGEYKRLAKSDWKFRLYNFLRHPTKPHKLKSGNVGIWRSDFERVNGFDENYRGWGCEDDDLGLRLRAAGVRLGSMLRWTRSYHIWHPREATAGARWKDGPNVGYFQRRGRLTCCRNGLVKRGLEDLQLHVVGGEEANGSIAFPFAAAGRSERPTRPDKPEVEVLLAPSAARFSPQAECKVLVVLNGNMPNSRVLKDADVVIAPRTLPLTRGQRQFALADLENALGAVA